MNTVIENIREQAEQIKTIITDLIENHSEIYRWNEPDSGFIGMGNYAWRDLSLPGKQLQSKALNEYRHFYEILKTLLLNQSEDDLNELDEQHKTVLSILEQKEHLYEPKKDKKLNGALSAIDKLLSLTGNIYDSGTTGYVLVPDTNALIYNPDIESWAFTDIPKFTIALVPVVLSELDRLKIDHRNENVRAKAGSLIRRIKEYRRRGPLAEGVTIRKDVINLKAFAIEPVMANSLPWLQKDNQDDRLLAHLVEVMRANPSSSVLLVTGDINLQNKAEFARLPFLEPPDPA